MSNPSNFSNNKAVSGKSKGSPEVHQTEPPATQAAEGAAVEKLVVDEPLSQPDYPCYRIQPGERISLATLDPNTSEHYKKKKHVEAELEKHRKRIQQLQERLYAENQRSLLIVLQAIHSGARSLSLTAPIMKMF